MKSLCSLLAALLLVGCAQFDADAPQAGGTLRHRVESPAVVPPAARVGGSDPMQALGAPLVSAPEPIAARVQDDLNPEQPDVNFQAPQAHTDLWVRLRVGLQLPNVTGPLLERWEAYYAKRPDYVARMMARGGRYLFHIVEEVERRQLPMELALLPFIESAFNPEAMSHARASGMWQFMSATGKDFALKQNLFRDDRRDVLASTRAALDYLAQLGRRYNGDWQLALAAYNWGMGNVDRAVKRARASGKEGRYAELKMPIETADYVPKLQAVKNLVLEPERFGVLLPLLDNHPYFLSVRIERDIDVELAAELAGLTPEVFRQFNPQMNKPVVLAAATPLLLLPYDNAERFMRRLAEHQGPLATWTAWQLPKTMKPAEAAQHIGMSEALLREVNRIHGRMLIKAGSTLVVPRTAKRDHDVSEHLADTAQLALSPEQRMRRRTVKARAGDTLASVAKRHGVHVAQLIEWNAGHAASGGRLKAGASVTLMQPVRSTSKAATRPASAKKASPRHAPAKGRAPGRRSAR